MGDGRNQKPILMKVNFCTESRVYSYYIQIYKFLGHCFPNKVTYGTSVRIHGSR